jgi:NB-ARC domain
MGADLFVGRETELQEMEDILQPKSKSPDRRVLVLGGMGGIGKTQLAISYAKQHRDSYSSAFWLNAASEATMNSSLRVVANRILLPATVGKLDDDQLRIEVLNWLSELENFRWLLILDNHNDPDGYKIQEYFPFVAHGSIIITTQLPDRLTGKKVKVRSMKKEEDSLRILVTRSGREDAESGDNILALWSETVLIDGQMPELFN